MHIGQKFEQEKYFWSRPSATDYNTLPASGSNLGPTSALLQRQVEERRAAFQSGSVPSELLFCSGSGLDPHLTLEGIYFQIERVAKARQLDPDQLKRFVDTYIIKRHFGLLGDHLINVLLLNQALDEKEEKIE
jgi:K+-transporting ATPase ATPase C chain